MRKVLLRLPDNVYDALKSDAAERGKSMNASAVELFSTFFELALRQLQPDALSVEYVARAGGRWSNTP